MSELFGSVNVQIKGLTPLLMNKLNLEDLKTSSRKRIAAYDVEAQAKRSAYTTKVGDEEQLYIPAEWIYSCLINTARQYRVRRVSASAMLAGSVRVEPDQILLGTNKYAIDTRSVVIQGSRVLKARPMLKEWAAPFKLLYYKRQIPKEQVPLLKEILEDGGIRMGIGDYRPQHKGWFGTFIVTEFKSED